MYSAKWKFMKGLQLLLETKITIKTKIEIVTIKTITMLCY
jgi:hypothetical protein